MSNVIYDEDDLLMLSGLQHLAFCERQWALIHVEGQWVDNRLTAEGNRLHERVDSGERERRGDLLIARSLRIRSLRLGLAGVADVVQFTLNNEQSSMNSQRTVVSNQQSANDHDQSFIHSEPLFIDHGSMFIVDCLPVEYKRGRPKAGNCDRVQLCAQAMCLEEMLGLPVGKGALFYGQRQRRTDVTFDNNLRTETEALAARMHELYRRRDTPSARYEKKCDACSLYEICGPKLHGRSVRNYQLSISNDR